MVTEWVREALQSIDTPESRIGLCASAVMGLPNIDVRGGAASLSVAAEVRPLCKNALALSGSRQMILRVTNAIALRSSGGVSVEVYEFVLVAACCVAMR